jgi:hypothetical protein
MPRTVVFLSGWIVRTGGRGSRGLPLGEEVQGASVDCGQSDAGCLLGVGAAGTSATVVVFGVMFVCSILDNKSLTMSYL